MPSKYINKNIATKLAAFGAICYVLCCLLDYMFFDYGWDFIWGKQILSCLLMASFLLVCLALGRAGYVVFIFFCAASALLAYAHHVFGYELTYDGVAGLFETNARELSGFMTTGLVFTLATVVIVPVGVFCLLRKTVRLTGWKVRLLVGVGALSGFVFLFNSPMLAYWVRPSVYKRTCSLTHRALPELYETGHNALSAQHLCVPFSRLRDAIVMTYRYFAQPMVFEHVEDHPSKCNVELQEDLVVVLVIGESVRADHCSFNGYGKPTMEEVSKIPGVVVLPDMWSFGPSTYVSLEGILAGLHVPDVPATHTSFAGLFRKHSFYTRFVSENTEDSLSGQKLWRIAGYAFDKRDGLFMPILDLADLLGKDLDVRREKGYLLVIENGTGHFPYQTEESHRRFRPDRGDLTDLNAHASRIINDYDNCIYSVNLFLARLMNILKDRKAVLIYCSDHGQRLGEGGSWAHGVACREIQHVGAFVWFSPAYEAANPEYIAALKEASSLPHCHGQIFATLLKLAGISTEAVLETGDLTQSAPAGAPVHLPPTVGK